jgi:PEGA domain
MAFALVIAIVSSGVRMQHAATTWPDLVGAIPQGPHRRQDHTVAIIRIARFWQGGGKAAATQAPAVIAADPLLDSLDAFGSESDATFQAPAAGGAAPSGNRGRRPQIPAITRRVAGAALTWATVVLVSGTAAAAVWTYQIRAASAPETGSLTIQTSPAGLPVGVNGQAAGVTPLTITLAPATYAIQVGSGARRRDLTVDIAAGRSVLQHLETAAPAELAASPTGSLQVVTEPAGKIVSIGGVDRGRSPVTIDALPAGDHILTVRGTTGSVRRTVTVKAGETVSLVMSAATPGAPAAGWLSVRAASRLELREHGTLIGTTETDRIMLPAGDHDIEIVNDAVGYRSTRQVEVLSGRTTTVPVELPFGSISINAQPWAEVWIGGERIGDTPIANVTKRIGSYEVVLRHPELGERRETVLVTLRHAARLGVDMRAR